MTFVNPAMIVCGRGRTVKKKLLLHPFFPEPGAVGRLATTPGIPLAFSYAARQNEPRSLIGGVAWRMLTARGWWFLIGSLLVLALGLFAEIAPLAPVGLTLVVWIVGVGLLFYARARLAVRRLRVVRVVADERGPV